LIPSNCSQSFTISNTGPDGSILNYTVKDDGALGGFLSFTPSSGSLPSGASVAINVEVKTAFVNDNAGLSGASLVLNVYTPQASNYQKIAVPVNIKSIISELPLLLGTWNGKWSGKTGSGPFAGDLPATVSGTWSLFITGADTAGKTITGSLTWIGNDAYWPFNMNSSGTFVSSTLTPLPVNVVLPLNASNTSFSIENGCNAAWIFIQIKGGNGASNLYGPSMGADFNINADTIATFNSWFMTEPSSYNTSVGTLTGAKP
jgi:hypothetical protein